jgi:hypothetical protein
MPKMHSRQQDTAQKPSSISAARVLLWLRLDRASRQVRRYRDLLASESPELVGSLSELDELDRQLRLFLTSLET